MPIKSIFSFFKKKDTKISNPISTSKTERAPRVKASHQHKFVFSHKGSHHEIRVLNLSNSGLALENLNTLHELKIGETLIGELKLSGNSFQTQLKTVRITQQLLGCVFTSSSSELKNAIYNEFKPEFAAVRTTKIRPELLKSIEEGDPHFFISPDGRYELYYISLANQLIHFNVTCLGEYLEWSTNTPLYFGTIPPLETNEKPKYKAAQLIQTTHSQTSQNQNDHTPNTEILKNARRFIQNIEMLDPSISAEILKTI